MPGVRLVNLISRVGSPSAPSSDIAQAAARFSTLPAALPLPFHTMAHAQVEGARSGRVRRHRSRRRPLDQQGRDRARCGQHA
ncbi:hypothetical protein VARIO8X_90481 [Burkholderiales bacterium 8X]|nr:hypothetical protein VARIO8X_90481 [Burkholderiales bacterium 8X]